MSTTLNLGITKLDAGLRQPEIVINNALDTLDAQFGTGGAVSGVVALVNALDYGVLNDGTAQSATALQNAMNAARDSSGQYTGVYMPPGQYLISSGSLTIWQGLALIGSWRSTQGHSWKRFSGLPDATDNRGTTIQITAGSGTSTGAFITMHSNSLLRGVVFYYPNQSTSATTPTAYPWTVFIGKNTSEGQGDVTVEDCEFVNSYQAIQSKWSARLHIRNIGGAPVFGIDIDKSYDSTWFENVQWNTYRFSSFDATAPNNNYGLYVNQNGVGIKVGRVDNLMLLNCFVLGYQKGLETVETATEGSLPGGKPWMQVVGGGFESCKFGAYLAAAQNPRVGEGAGIEFIDVNTSGYDAVAANGGFGYFITAAFSGDLKVIGGRLGYGSGPDHISNILILGGGRITIQNVQFIHATSNNIFADAPGGGGGLGDLALTVVANQFEASVGASVAIEGFTTGLIAANSFISKSSSNAFTESAETGYNVTIAPSNRFGGDNVVPWGKASAITGRYFPESKNTEQYGNVTNFAAFGATAEASLTHRGVVSGGNKFGCVSINSAFNGTDWLRQNDAFDAWLIQGWSTTGSTGAFSILHAPAGSGAITWTPFFLIGANGAATFDSGTATATAGAATLNKQSGTVTSESLTTAAGSDYVLTLTNSLVSATSKVIATVDNGSNTTEGISVQRVTPGSGSVVIRVRNTHASSALNGTIKISFVVF